MSKIIELRNKRNTLWEQTKAFLEQHRDENGLVAADAVKSISARMIFIYMSPPTNTSTIPSAARG